MSTKTKKSLGKLDMKKIAVEVKKLRKKHPKLSYIEAVKKYHKDTPDNKKPRMKK